MYGDIVTKDMRLAINETNSRRAKQKQYNREHNIIPTSITKEVRNLIENIDVVSADKPPKRFQIGEKYSQKEIKTVINNLEREMDIAARNWEFERAALIRDEILRLREYEEMSGRGTSNIRAT